MDSTKDPTSDDDFILVERPKHGYILDALNKEIRKPNFYAHKLQLCFKIWGNFCYKVSFLDRIFWHEGTVVSQTGGLIFQNRFFKNPTVKTRAINKVKQISQK